MNEKQEGTVRYQEHLLSTEVRKLCEAGSFNESLKLLERFENFFSTNLVTLVKIYAFTLDEEIKAKAILLFIQYTQKADTVNKLLNIAGYLTSLRCASLDKVFLNTVSIRRFALEPGWNGEWVASSINGQVKMGLIINKKPHEVHDPDVCLDMAAQIKDHSLWIVRYFEIGGQENNPKYLKILIGFWATRNNAPPKNIKKALVRYIEIVNELEARRYLRNLTKLKTSKKRCVANMYIINMALHFYGSTKKFVLAEDDWVHIGKCSISLQNEVVQKLVLRNLAMIKRAPSTQLLFDELIKMHGFPNLKLGIQEDARIANNPVWDNIFLRLPVNADARRILMDYSGEEFERI